MHMRLCYPVGLVLISSQSQRFILGDVLHYTGYADFETNLMYGLRPTHIMILLPNSALAKRVRDPENGKDERIEGITPHG